MRWRRPRAQRQEPEGAATPVTAPDEYEATKRSYLLELDRGVGTVNVVFGIGKTGTTTIATALKRSGLSPVLQVHNLGPRLASRREAQFRLQAADAFPRHIWESQWLTAHPPSGERPWKIVTPVRDPVAVLVSTWFQEAARFESLGDDATVSRVVDALSTRWTRPPNDWFDFQFKRLLGIDVYDHPFDPAVGHAVIETEAADVLLLRQESFDKAPLALDSFFRWPVAPHFRAENVSREKAYAALYQAVLERVRPPVGYVDQVYSSRMARHFYAREELDGFKRHWTRPTE